MQWKFVASRVLATFIDLVLFTLPALLISSAPTLFGVGDGVMVGDTMVASLLGCALMFAGRVVFEARGKSTPGRLLTGLVVNYGDATGVDAAGVDATAGGEQRGGQSGVWLRAMARNSWALIPAIGWLVVFFANGQQFPWNDNPFDLVVFILLGMIVISKDGSHIFDTWAKARVRQR